MPKPPRLPFDDWPPERIWSPLCLYQSECPRRGVAELGPPEDHGDCVNRPIRCLTCGATGIESMSIDPKSTHTHLLYGAR